MRFSLEQSLEILRQTPYTLESLLQGLSPGWISGNEGADSWAPYDVVGHLIHGEKTDWIPRLTILLSAGKEKVFEPFDRLAQFKNSDGQSLTQLLGEFKRLREENLRLLLSAGLTEKEYQLTATHPALGTVTLKQLLATWVVHDLSHLAQVARVMAKQYKEEVGPWIEFLPVLTKP